VFVAPIDETRVLFTANQESGGFELWESDGTAAGTRMFDIAPGIASSEPWSIVVSGATAYFAADGSAVGEPLDRELWALPIAAPAPLPEAPAVLVRRKPR
jgi:ELWxxDGT repeat protein